MRRARPSCLPAMVLAGGGLWLGLGLVLACAGRVVAEPAQPFVLAEAGTSAYRIVLQPSASASEKHAAAELRRYIEACTGAAVPIETGQLEGNGPMIVLGRGPVAESLGVAPTDEQLGEQGFVLKTVGPNVVIAGTARAGTLRGARHFLQGALGVRWYAPGVTVTPREQRLVVPPLDVCSQPAFLWRQTSYAWPDGDAEFRARRGLNDGDGGPDAPLGQQYAFDGTCHSYFRFIGPEEFFDTHPEYFAEIGGRRVREETQLCLTNPDVLRIVTERMLERMKAQPGVRQHNFSQMDWYNGCECEQCRAMNEKYGSAGGTQFWFVSQLAEQTSKVYPDKLIGTLAYTYTEEPPRDLPIHPNVAVWLCHMYPCCDSHPIESCPLNAEYRRRAEAWSKLCRHLYIWHYVVDFAHYYNPFPNFRALAADLRFYRRLGVEGVFAQAMGEGGGGGEWSLLRGYYVSELLENPDQSAEAILRDFLQGYYGPAADPLWSYIQLLHDRVQGYDVHMHLYTNPAQGYLTDEVLARAEAFFDEAEAAVRHDATLLERVRVARMPLVYAKLFPRNGYRIDGDRLLFEGPLAQPSEAQAFVDRMKQHGFRTIREMGGDPSQLPTFAAMLNTPMPLVTLKNEHLRVEIAPLLGGRVLRIVDLASGECATAFNTTRDLFFPFCGGEETRVGGPYAVVSGGSFDPALPSKASETSVTLVANLGVAYRLERTISLLPDRPTLTILARVTNLGKEPRVTQLRSHLSLDLGDVSRTRIRFTDRGGKAMETDTGRAIANLREGERFYREACPAGAWTFAGSKGLEVTERFDPEAVAFTWIYAYPADLNELEVELWAKETNVPPGESVTLAHMLEIRGLAGVDKPPTEGAGQPKAESQPPKAEDLPPK